MERLVGRLIYIDTNCFIYLLEEHPLFGERAYRIFTALENGKSRAITSVLTLMEVMEVLAIVPKLEADSWLQQFGDAE